MQALKLQQKMVPRALSDLQKNVTSAVTSIAAELSSFHARLSELEAASEAAPSMCMAELLAEDREEGGEKGGFMNDSMRRSSTSQIVPQHDGNRPAEGFHYDVDLQSIVKELAALRTAAQRNNRREFAMVSADFLPRFSCGSPLQLPPSMSLLCMFASEPDMLMSNNPLALCSHTKSACTEGTVTEDRCVCTDHGDSDAECAAGAVPAALWRPEPHLPQRSPAASRGKRLRGRPAAYCQCAAGPGEGWLPKCAGLCGHLDVGAAYLLHACKIWVG